MTVLGYILLALFLIATSPIWIPLLLAMLVLIVEITIVVATIPFVIIMLILDELF